MVKKTILFLAVILLFCCLSGCASIVSKSNWPVTVQSNPAGAECVISKASGVPLQMGKTPMTISLDSSRGFFLPAKYNIKCTKEGYLAASSEFSADLNPWYIGNIFFGGLIGWLIVDPATGTMWRHDETQILNLAPSISIVNKDSKQNLIVEKNTNDITPQVKRKDAKPSTESNQRYKGIKAIVLENGDVIIGQIISMNTETVKIRTTEGKILSYSFMKEVKAFIKE